jgi:hypothetical protein
LCILQTIFNLFFSMLPSRFSNQPTNFYNFVLFVLFLLSYLHFYLLELQFNMEKHNAHDIFLLHILSIKLQICEEKCISCIKMNICFSRNKFWIIDKKDKKKLCFVQYANYTDKCGKLLTQVLSLSSCLSLLNDIILRNHLSLNDPQFRLKFFVGIYNTWRGSGKNLHIFLLKNAQTKSQLNHKTWLIRIPFLAGLISLTNSKNYWNE